MWSVIILVCQPEHTKVLKQKTVDLLTGKCTMGSLWIGDEQPMLRAGYRFVEG